jgi:hypothetical protein
MFDYFAWVNVILCRNNVIRGETQLVKHVIGLNKGTLNSNPEVFIISCHACVKQMPVCDIAKSSKVTSKIIGEKNIDETQGTLYFLPGGLVFVPASQSIVGFPVRMGLGQLVYHISLVGILDTFYGESAGDCSQLLRGEVSPQ